MANYSELKNAINTAIKQNGNREITGEILNSILNTMVNSLGANYSFAGFATPSTNPGTPDYNVLYIAFKAGTYVNFGYLDLPQGLTFLTWNGAWVANVLYTIDDVPTSGSRNLVKSGGIRSQLTNAMQQLRGYGISASDEVAYIPSVDPVFYCGFFSKTYHGEYATAIMNEELDKLHTPNGSGDTYECNAQEETLRHSRRIPEGLCHVNIHGSQIWFINNVENYAEDRWTQIFFNVQIGRFPNGETAKICVYPGRNIVIRTRIKANDSDEKCTLWGDFYEIPYNITEKFFPSDPQINDNANRITETGFRGYVNVNIPVESGMTWGNLAVRRASTPDANGYISIEQTFYARDGNHIGKSWRRLGLIDPQGTVTFFNWYE